jgi:hypothetical protein
MRSGFSGVLFLAVLALLWPWAAAAQSDEPSLGDLARSLRRNKTPQDRPVIDNDNLAQAMEDVKKLKPANRMVFSVDPSGKGFKVSSADVTCSLSFNANAASLLIKPLLVEDVPVGELLKLDGPASIQDDNLQLEVFNGTDWELREITVGLTLERKPGESAEMAAGARVIPAAEGLAPVAVEKHSDVTVLYHLKATAKPFSTAVFRENIGITPAADQDWRLSIVEAKGIRPQPDQIPSEPLPPAMPLALPSPTAPGPVTTLSVPPASAPRAQDKPANFSDFPR